MLGRWRAGLGRKGCRREEGEEHMVSGCRRELSQRLEGLEKVGGVACVEWLRDEGRGVKGGAGWARGVGGNQM